MYWSAGTGPAARVATGCVLEAVSRVLGGGLRNAMAVVRPPGHHARCGCYSGFCFFNHVAVAAKAALGAGARRVAIVDWDVHHGDGTQQLTESNPNILFVSMHRFGRDFFPGTGAASDVGPPGPAAGTTVNIPFTETGAGEIPMRFLPEPQ